jgi:predicted PurR-regulated permease PerM
MMDSNVSRPLAQPRQDLTRVTLGVLFIGTLLVASFWVMQPFLPAIIWAATLVLATWPLLLWLQRHTGNRRGLAVAIMTMTLLLLVIAPFWLALSTVITNIDKINDLVRSILSLRLPVPPAWLADVPLVGARAVGAWEKLNSAGVQELVNRLTPYAGTLTYWIASMTGSLGGMFIHFLLTTAIAAVMYSGGERAADTAVLFGRRLGGVRGAMAVVLAGQAIRAVALGVVVTAVAQSVVAGIGLAISGVPYAALLAALIFILCLIQLGPLLVMGPAVIWMYSSGETLLATVLLAFTIVASTMDQFIRPVLIRRGADLPMLLILAGVIGGLVTFGILGIFIGPTVLAVAYTLLNAWMEDGPDEDAVPQIP